MQSTRLVRNTLGLLAALAVAASQSGCDNKSYTSPTGPPPVVAVPPAAVTGLLIGMLVAPVDDATSFPVTGELFVDGRSVSSGPMGDPEYNCDPAWDRCDINLAAAIYDSLPAGAHTLTFRVTKQRRSPTRYTISGKVSVRWEWEVPPVSSEFEPIAEWSNALVQLRTGQDWTIPFTIPSQP